MPDPHCQTGASRFDTAIYSLGTVAAGGFALPAEHPDFHDCGPAGAHLVMFARSSSRILPSFGRPFHFDPLVVALYDDGEEETHEAVDPRGIVGDWFALSAPLARELASEHQVDGAGRTGTRSRACASSSARAWLSPGA